MARRVVQRNNNNETGAVASVMRQADSFRKERERIEHLSEDEKRELTKDIPVDDLVPFPENSDVFGENSEQISLTAEAIKKHGFYGAIWVIPDKDGKYMIISGHQRWMAAKEAGEKTIPAFVYNNLDTETVYRMWIDSNQLQRKSSAYAKYRLIQSARHHIEERAKAHDPEYTNINVYDKLVEITHIGKSAISRYEQISKLPPYTAECCKEETFPYTTVLQVAKMSDLQKSVFDKELKTYMESLGEELPEADKIRKIIKDVLSGKSAEFDHQGEEDHQKDTYASLSAEGKLLYEQAKDKLDKDYQKYASEKQHKHETHMLDDQVKDLAFQMNYCLEDTKAMVLDPKTVTASLAMMTECIRKLKKMDGIY